MLIKFLKLNKKILVNYKSKKKIALVNRERPMSALQGSIIVSAIANDKKFETIIITDKLYNDLHNVFKSFGFVNFFIVSGLKNYLLNIKITIFSIIKTIFAIFNISILGFNNFINNFSVQNILLGDLIYDSYIRYDKKFLNPKIEIKLIKILFFSIFKVFRLDNFFKKNDIKYLFVQADCYANNETISTRIALKNQTKVFKINTFGRIFLTEAKNYQIFEGYMPLRRYFSPKKINKIISISDKKLIKFFEKRFIGDLKSTYTNPVDLKNANNKTSNYTKKSLIKKLFNNQNNYKKIILFAPHAFADSPHHFGINYIFRDYYEQFTETMNFINENNKQNILWLIRPHPSSKIYGEEEIVKSYIGSGNNNVKFCDNKLIGTKNLIEICDTVVTGRGTVGLEFACFGKKPIVAGSSTYSKFGINIECKNKKNYFKILNEINKIKPLNKKQINLAQKILFYIEMIYPKNISKYSEKYILTGNNKSVLDLLNNNYSQKKSFFNSIFLRSVKNKSFDQDKLYKFYKKNSKYI